MKDIKKECQLLNDDIKKIVVNVRAAETKRLALGRAEVPIFNTAIATATENVREAQEAVADAEEVKASQSFYVPAAIQQMVSLAKKELVMWQTIQSKLSKAKKLCFKISDEDRQRAVKINQLQAQANDLVRLLPGTATDAQLKQAQEKIEAIKKQINELYAQILENEKRIQHYLQLLHSYSEANPEWFAAHWLEAATVILEREDAYGFTGTILYRDLGTRQTPNAGLEAGSSVSYGTILQEDQVIEYTYPNTEISIKQDHTGKITDKGGYKDENEENLAAIKVAKLLLMDCKLRKDMHMYIKGPASVLPQTMRVIAALRVLAEEAGIDLKDDKGNSVIDVKVPGWDAQTMDAQINVLVEGMPATATEPAKPGIRALIHSRAKDEFKKIHEQLNATPDLAEDETVLRNSRGPGGFGVTR